MPSRDHRQSGRREVYGPSRRNFRIICRRGRISLSLSLSSPVAQGRCGLEALSDSDATSGALWNIIFGTRRLPTTTRLSAPSRLVEFWSALQEQAFAYRRENARLIPCLRDEPTNSRDAILTCHRATLPEISGLDISRAFQKTRTQKE